MNSENVIFVGGSMRSGTTILHRVLSTAEGSHPYISEAWFIFELMRTRSSVLSSYDIKGLDYFGSREAFDTYILNLIESHIGDVARRYHPASRVFIKHPELTRLFGTFGRWFPRSPFVVSIRDPRDTIASMVRVAERQSARGVTPPPQIRGRNMRTLCETFLSNYRWMETMPASLAGRVTTVRYEALMTDTAATVADLARALEVKIDLDRIAAFGETRERSANFDPAIRASDPLLGGFFSELYNSNLTPSRIGRHVEVLTQDEIAEIERRCAAFATRHGYW